MSKLEITIIIVTFNSEKYIEKCMESCLGSLTKVDNYKILIIDNKSSDNTIKKVKSFVTRSSNFKLIENRSNLGFAKAVDIGINIYADSNYYLLLNPDTVLNSKSVSNLIKCAKHNKAGIVGGSTFDDKGHENGSYFRFPNLMVGIFDFTNLRKIDKSDKWHRYFYYLDVRGKKRPFIQVDVVTGGYMLISKKTIQKIGVLDQRFFMYLEDVDYCLRARNAGISVFHCNESKIIHYSGRSSNNKDRIRHSSWMISRKKYFLKNFNLITNIIIQPIFLIDDLVILVNKYLK